MITLDFFWRNNCIEVHDISEEDGLDFLLNNAGVMMHPQLMTEDKFEIHLQVNYLGNSRLTISVIAGNLSRQ